MQHDETLDEANRAPVSIRPHAGPAQICTVSCGSRGGGPEWFCAITQPRQEDRADEELRRQGFVTFLPTVWERRTKNRKIIRVEVPMFDGYIFVRFDPVRDPWGVIPNTRGIRDAGLLGMRPGRPSPVPAALIDFIATHAAELNADFVARAKASLNGRTLLVTAGAWSGFQGVCTMHRNDRVRVLLTLFGRPTEVEMPTSRVEKV